MWRWTVCALGLVACGRFDFEQRDGGTRGDGIRADAADAASARCTTCPTVAGGLGHTCALDQAGDVWCWGDNGRGQVGATAAGAMTTTPVRVTSGPAFDFVAAGYEHSCAIAEAGTLWCWGANEYGQLGVGDYVDRAQPTQVGTDADWASVDATVSHTCATKTNGTVLCAGWNLEGQLGRGFTSVNPDGLAQFAAVGAEQFQAVSTGQGHSCALQGGTVWCWGANDRAQLLLAAGTSTPTATSTSGLAQLASGWKHNLALDGAGTLWAWGDNSNSQLGLGALVQANSIMQVSSRTWRSVDTQVFHTCAIEQSGTLWCWGRNVEGQLGGTLSDPQMVPVEVDSRTDWVEIRLGRFHTCARRSDFSLWCTGDNPGGQLGLGDTTRRFAWTLVSYP